MRVLPWCVLVAALVHARPRQEEQVSIAEEIDALVEKTNAYHLFRAVYEIVKEGEDDAKVSFELTYVEPGSVAMSINGDLTYIVVDERHYLQDKEHRWITFELEEPNAHRALQEGFPSDEPLGAGISFDVDPRTMSFAVMPAPTRPALLVWLTRMGRVSERLTESPDQLVWTSGCARLAVSRKSGFPEELRGDKEGLHQVATLVKLELGDEAPDTIVLPEEARSAPVDDAARDQVQRGVLATLRNTGFSRVESRLRDGTIEWDARTHEKWEAFLEPLHRDMIALTWLVRARSLHDAIDRLCEDLSESLDEEDTPELREQLHGEVSTVEQTMVATLKNGPEKYLEELPAIGSDSAKPRDELYAVEREVVERLYAELVTKPVLDYLHEQVDAVLGDEEH